MNTVKFARNNCLYRFLKKPSSLRVGPEWFSPLEANVHTSLKTLWFKGLKSIHMCTLPLGLGTTTMTAHQEVGV